MPDLKDLHLGIYTGHNATVALVQGGRVLACVSEERFTSVKNQTGYPHKALQYLESLGLSPERLASVNLCFERLAPQVGTQGEGGGHSGFGASALLYALYQAGQRLGMVLPPVRKAVAAAYEAYYRVRGPRNAQAEAERVAGRLGVPAALVQRHEHHLCHAYSAYYGSPVSGQDALVLTLDGEGDTLCSTVSTVRGGRWQRLAQSPSSASIGLLYTGLTEHLGMKANEHEYKVMGLAAYAKRQYIDKLIGRMQGVLGFDRANPMVWSSAFDLHQSRRWIEKELKGQRFDVMAGAFQTLVEDRLCEWVSHCMQATGLKKVVCGGGVFMNVKANLRLAQLPGMESIFIFPSCGDDSVPIGAAYAGYLSSAGGQAGIEPIGPIYWGPAYDDAQVRAFLEQAGAAKKYKVQALEDPEDAVAELLARHEVVARLSGRMEFGARALGNRSILAHPGDQDVIRIINEQMKNRDFWMPFAGSVLEERVGDYLEGAQGRFSPYMMMGFHTTEKARKEIRAALHPYDFTMRPQMVRESMNPSYHKLIKRFEARTGLGAVLNTSFNLHGLPVVLGPAEAYHAFENSGLQHLVMEKTLVSKN